MAARPLGRVAPQARGLADVNEREHPDTLAIERDFVQAAVRVRRSAEVAKFGAVRGEELEPPPDWLVTEEDHDIGLRVTVTPERVEEIASALGRSYGSAVEADPDAPRIIVWHVKGGVLAEIAFGDDGAVGVDLLDGRWLQPLAGRALSVRFTDNVEAVGAAIVEAVGEMLDEIDRIQLVVDGNVETTLLGFVETNQQGLASDAISDVCRLGIGEEYGGGGGAAASWSVRRSGDVRWFPVIWSSAPMRIRRRDSRNGLAPVYLWS